MNERIQNEARLERSLRAQLIAPKLDGRFDAAVWSRIAAEEKRALPPKPVRRATPRWLMVSNLSGVAVTVALVGFYLVQSMSGVELHTGLNWSLPAFSGEGLASLMIKSGPIVATAAVLFGFAFTRQGRKLISALR